MIKIEYVDESNANNRATQVFSDEASLTQVLAGLVRVTEFATYSNKSYDHILSVASEYDGDCIAESILLAAGDELFPIDID